MKTFLRLSLGIILVLSSLSPSFAQLTQDNSLIQPYDLNAEVIQHRNPPSPVVRYRQVVAPVQDPARDPVKEREKEEEEVPANYFAITPYMPNYILPYYYTVSPYDAVYAGNTPNDESLNHAEVKYQISLKVPLWKNIMHETTSLYFAYTQLSYWQLYNDYAFFRETDYQPEVFFAHEMDYRFFKYWHVDSLNVGAVHQSNGYGNSLERTWNRIYLEAIFSTDNWMVSIKPWYIIENGSLNKYNPDIAQFLGYGRLLIAREYKGHVFSLSLHNFIEGYARRITGEFTWSFPLTAYLKGYVQVFSGYGQSLIEYNHRTNSAGVGIALNDWI